MDNESTANATVPPFQSNAEAAGLPDASCDTAQTLKKRSRINRRMRLARRFVTRRSPIKTFSSRAG